MKTTLFTGLTVSLLIAASAVAAQSPAGGAPAGGPPAEGGKMPTGAEFIAQMDTNKDGVADKKEAAANERFAADFDKADANHDGKVTADEMTKFFAAMAASAGH